MPAASEMTLRMRAASAAGVLGAVVAGWGLVVVTGGTPNAWAHVLYVPILVASLLWGLRGAVLVAVVSGVLLGPLSPHAASMTDAAFHASWLTRLGFFLAIGILASLGLAWAQRRDRQLRAVVANAADLVLLTDPRGVIQFASPSAIDVLGHQPQLLIGRRATDLVHHDDDARIDEVAGVIRVRHADGSWRHLEVVASQIPAADGTVTGIVINARDVTERQALQAQISHLTYHDPTTALPNRSLMLTRVDGSLADHATGVAVVAVVVEHFDDLVAAVEEGAEAGILIRLADRLETLVRESDCVARIGDTTLGVCCHNVRTDSEAEALLDRLSRGLSEPITIASQSVHVKVSMGVALADGAATAEQLLQRATAARRSAHQASRQSAVYQPGQTSPRRSDIVAGLHQALERSQFELHYQPVVRMPTNDVVSVEALIRWHHPTAGLVPPNEFIPIAEQAGLIEPIGRWVLHEACRQLAAWRAADPALASLGVAINVSAHQLLSRQLRSDIDDAIERTGLDPKALTLEITESAIMQHLETASDDLRAIKTLGVSVAVDDFGTGYSSLGYLRALPVDVLKIDRLFINDLQRPEGQCIISAIIGLAHSFGLAAVAEGVEDHDQWKQLLDLGCDFAQGYYLARPLPADHLVELLRAADHLPLRPAEPQLSPITR